MLSLNYYRNKPPKLNSFNSKRHTFDNICDSLNNFPYEYQRLEITPKIKRMNKQILNKLQLKKKESLETKNQKKKRGDIFISSSTKTLSRRKSPNERNLITPPPINHQKRLRRTGTIASYIEAKR